MARFRPELRVAAVLVVATLVVYVRLVGSDFVNYDDPDYVTANPYVRAGLTAAGVSWAFTTGHAGNWHPLTWLSHMLDVDVWGLHAGGHHFTNVLLHTANALLLFAFLRATTGALWPSAAVAALFALHPLHVESVAWVSERKDVLSTFFWMLTLLAYWRWVRRPGVARYVLALVLLALGLMAKPMLVTVPLVMLLLDVWPLGRLTGREKRAPRALVVEKVPFLLVVLASALVTFAVQLRGGAVAAVDTLPFRARAANAVVAAAAYLGKAIWPSGLILFYPHVPLPASRVVGAGVALVAVSAVVARFTRRWPWLGVGWLWYAITLLPVLGLVQVGDQAMADRFTYVPLIGPFVMVVWSAAAVADRRPVAMRAVAIVGGLLLAACAVVGWRQVGYWRNSVALWAHATDVVPANYVAQINLGNAVAEEGRFDEAIAHYEAAVRAKPDFAKAYNNLGVLLARTGRTDEAVARYREALRLDPALADAHNNFGAALAAQGRLDDAIAQYDEALRLNPSYPDAHANLGIALAAQGNLDQAIAHYTEALRLKPDHPGARASLARALAARGER